MIDGLQWHFFCHRVADAGIPRYDDPGCHRGDWRQNTTLVLRACRPPAQALADHQRNPGRHLANHAMAGLAGNLVAGVVPRTPLMWATGLAFIAFGVWALHPDSLEGSPAVFRGGVFVTALVAFFLAEMGDKTQLATVALAARFEALAQVIVGTTFGMMIANIPAVWIGDRLAQKVPMKAVRILAAALFVLTGVITLSGTFASASLH